MAHSEAHTAPSPSFYIIAITHMASGTMGILMRPLPRSQVCSMLIDVIRTDIMNTISSDGVTVKK